MNKNYSPGKLHQWWHHENMLGTEQKVSGRTRVLIRVENITGEPGEDSATADRLADCWNACEGISPEAVPLMHEALRAAYKAMAAADPVYFGNVLDMVRIAITKAEAHQ